MEKNYLNDLDSLHRSQIVYVQNHIAMDLVDGNTAEKAIMDQAILKIEQAVMVQESPSGGESEASLAAKKEMAKIMVKFCLKGAVRARRAGNHVLAEKLHIVASDFMRAPKAIAVQIANAAKTLMNANLLILTNIHVADITAMGLKITAYDSIKDDPTVARETKKADGTDVIPIQIIIANEAKQNIVDYTKSDYADTNPQLVEKVVLAAMIITTGIDHTEIDFIALKDENGEAIEQFSVLDVTTGKTYVPDIFLRLHIPTHKAGNFHFTISAPGRIPVDFGATIHQSQHYNFTVRLKLITPPTV